MLSTTGASVIEKCSEKVDYADEKLGQGAKPIRNPLQRSNALLKMWKGHLHKLSDTFLSEGDRRKSSGGSTTGMKTWS